MLDFIAEHHGTQLIGYFHSRAKDEFGEDNVNESDFRYPGPKPQSKRTAIAMMADSIESATRVLQEPTPERVRSLVDGIVEASGRTGSLDEAPLTLREITVLKDTFVKVLSGIYPSSNRLPEYSASDRCAGFGRHETDDRSASRPHDDSTSRTATEGDEQMELGAVADEGA